MSYTLLNPQPGPRDAELDWNDAGPGLYPDESALTLEDGTLVAVSVVPKWLENGAGVAFTGWARWMNEDGSTRLCEHGQHIESSVSYTASAPQVAELGVPAIAKELLLVLLGEPLTQQTLDDDTDMDLIPWSPEFNLNASIRHAITAVEHTGPVAINPANILGL